MLKSILRSVLPQSIQDGIAKRRMMRIQQSYSRLSLRDVFERVYSSNAWATEEHSVLHSGAGSTGRCVDEYVVIMKDLIAGHHVESIADLGCGNFNTGRAISPLALRYIGVDIAQSVVDFNTANYATATVQFVRADLTKDDLPPADAAIVRQVLQHLTNDEIRAALNNILRAYPLVFVTEHIYAGEDVEPNVDFDHGPGTRVPMKSGVFIDLPPFGLQTRSFRDIDFGEDSVIRTWVVRRDEKV